MSEAAEPNTPLTALVGVLFAIVLFLTIVVLQTYFYHAEQSEAGRKEAMVPPEELAQLRAQQLETLHSYRWVDERAGVVAIPIERAMEIEAREDGRVPWPSVQPPPPGTAAATAAAGKQPSPGGVAAKGKR